MPRNDAFVELAANRLWNEVFAMLDSGEAGVDDYDEVRAVAPHLA